MQTLVSFEAPFDPAKVEARDVRVSLVPRDAGQALQLVSGQAQDWPGITLPAPGGTWDLTAFAAVQVEVRNTGAHRVTVCCRVDNPGGDGAKNCLTRSIELDPGKEGVLAVPLLRAPPATAPQLFGMRGFPEGLAPGGQGLDVAKIIQLIVFVPKPKEEHRFEIGPVRAVGAYQPPAFAAMTAAELFPMIDEFGQFIHKEWPGKVRSEADLAAALTAEDADLAAHPEPPQRNGYGGWLGGPVLPATGFFRTEKVEGRWWLVDPDGRLFWSHGADCVHGHNAVTPITDRTHWFRGLPAAEAPLARFYGKGNWAPHNYYEGREYQTFDFSAANLARKYGSDYEPAFAERTHRRLRSWGMNTIGNWSRREIYLMRRTPYVCTLHTGGRKIEGSQGYWGKFADVFDAGFAGSLRRNLDAEKGRSAGDPWCLGYFVDNELSWGDDTSLAVAALCSPPDQPAKLAILADLKAKYTSIEALNQAWGTVHVSWDALLQHREAPDRARAREDLTVFYTKVAETYFRLCREAVKAVAPQQLYLGCRFAWVNERAVQAAEKYCDVISYNLYRRSVADFRLPGGIDKPVIVGEFHFGALDRGMLHTGLVPTANQDARAQAYADYVTGALRNPQIVGTHWFQYGDQATTGRGDGENYQIGFVDVCDTPYPETVQACREVGRTLYETRLAAPTK